MKKFRKNNTISDKKINFFGHNPQKINSFEIFQK